jgi:hypothetical protein
MSPVELPVVATPSPPPALPLPRGDAEWLRIARRARALSWASLAWMTVEGVVGLIAGLDANALSVIVWAASSFVEGLASMIVIWRFSASRTLSEHSERAAQRLVAGSFLLLVPFFVYEAIHRLIAGSDTTTTSVLGIAVTASAIVLMPVLGWASFGSASDSVRARRPGRGFRTSCARRRRRPRLMLWSALLRGLG